MRRLLLAVVVGCGGTKDGDTSTGSSSGTTGAPAESSSSVSMSSTGALDCDAPPLDCTTCWTCARNGACKTAYDSCASNFECAGSLACVDYMCPVDGITQQCVDHCCQNCAEHNLCSLVDAVITCVEQQCADLCGPVTCTG